MHQRSPRPEALLEAFNAAPLAGCTGIGDPDQRKPTEVPIDLRFTTADARIKRKHRYLTVDPGRTTSGSFPASHSCAIPRWSCSASSRRNVTKLYLG